MKRHRLIYCFSTMVHKQNYLHVTSSEFIDTMVKFGHRLGIFCHYDPVGEEIDKYFTLSSEEIEEYGYRLEEMNRGTDIPLRDLDFLERSKGCFARRGISVYIDCFTGSVMPCFKTPYTSKECNVFIDPHKNRLFEILNSDFFKSYRNDYFDGRQCFSDMMTELNWFMERSDVSMSDREDIADHMEIFKVKG